MRKKRSLYDAYKFCNFKPQHKVSGIFGDSNALVIKLIRQGKKQSAAPATGFTELSMTARIGKFVIFPVVTGACTSNLRFNAFIVLVATR
ncbi:MAG: hypothetical protein A2Z58_00495 [Planctomycetes bacterium RIFCSPHIGHO2_12_42_15]|nr:MAG: hypothetical protein A2Z58_00495 [Planctomycetes bacterium RIFCSPHIGHO2_12_42_15]